MADHSWSGKKKVGLASPAPNVDLNPAGGGVHGSKIGTRVQNWDTGIETTTGTETTTGIETTTGD